MEHRTPNPTEFTDVTHILTEEPADAYQDIVASARQAMREMPESLFMPFGRPSFNAGLSDAANRHWQRLERLGYCGAKTNNAMRIR